MTPVAPPESVSRSNLASRLATGHCAMLIVFLSWRFGGLEEFSRLVAAAACLAAPVITMLAWRTADKPRRRRFVGIFAPLTGLALLVFLSALNPHMRMLTADGEPVALGARPDYLWYLPSSAWPRPMLQDFLLNAGLVLTGLNLFLAAPSRPQQRGFLALVAGNAVVLAIVGSAFKLAHATEILGLVPSPNENFFATFVYYNHWGGFAILGAAAAGALALYYRDRAPEGAWTQTPALMLGAFVIILLVSLVLSGARASLVAGFILALVLALRIVPGSSERGVRRLRVLSVLAVFGLVGATTVWIARDRIEFLFRKTSGQLTELRAGGMGDARLQIDRETWQLFLQRPVFGWGWQSFQYVFRRDQKFDFRMQNEQKTKTLVRDAHNDWLQLLAEMGLVGAALAGLTFGGIRRTGSPRTWRLSPSCELMAGAACVGLLALIDFPFACPAIVVTWWALVATAAAIAFDRQPQRVSA